MLAVLSDLRTQLNISGTDEDARLTTALNTATAMLEQHCRRRLEYVAADQTETYDGGDGTIYLLRWPVTTIVSVKEDLDGDFASVDALVSGTDYRLIADRGRLLRLPSGLAWLCGDRSVQVIYRGGWADPNSAAPSGTSHPPQHVQSACLLQAAECYKRRSDPGYKAAEGAAGGIQFGYSPDMKLVEAAEAVIASERRVAV